MRSILKYSILLFAVGTCVRCTPLKGYHFTLEGKISDVDTGKVSLLSSSRLITSTFMEGGKFILQGCAEEAGLFTLKLKGRTVPVFLDGARMKFSGSSKRLTPDSLQGSPANDARMRLDRILYDEHGAELVDSLLKYPYEKVMASGDQKWKDEMMSAMMSTDTLRYRLVLDFVKDHPDNIYSVHVANEEKGYHYEKGIEMYNLLSRRMQKSSVGKRLKADVDTLAFFAIGERFPVLEGVNEQGDTLRVDSWTGKVTVIDFWASWCGPCREEMQSLKQLHKDLEGKNVRFISISLDNHAKQWKIACDEERIPWESLRNPSGFQHTGIVKTLGIHSIPFIMTVDKDGKIAGKNLRRNLLRAKIQSLLEE